MPKRHHGSFLVADKGRGFISRAPLGRFGLRGGRCCVARLRSICGTATNKPLTAFRGSGNT
jgi:hypothetical protein